jgi:hypothetical protein
MNGFVGADVGQLQALAKRLENGSRRLDRIMETSSSSIMTASWLGADIDVIRSRWIRAVRPELAAATQALDQLSKKLLAQAQQQEEASEQFGTRRGESAAAADALRSLAGTAVLGAGLLLRVGDDAAGTIGVSDSRSRDFTAGEMRGSGSASYFVGAEGAAFRSATVGPEGLSAGVGASGSVGVVGSVEGNASLGVASVAGTAGVFGGARGSAGASTTVGPDGVSARVGVDAFAGVEATASGKVDVGGVTAGATAHAYAGIGGHANADVSVTAEKIDLSLDLGLAVGVGGGIKVDLSFSPMEAAKNIRGLFHLG